MEWVPSPLAVIAAWGLTATFAWAAVAKLVRGDAWAAAVAGFGFKGPVLRTVVVAVPIAEGVIVILFATGALRAAAAVTLALVASFSAAIVRARRGRRGNKVPCGCFGGASESDYRVLLGRNAGLSVLAALILLGPRSASLAPSTGTDLVPAALIVLAAVLVAWMAVSMVASLRRR